MKTVQLIHNPGAGYEGLTESDLVRMIESGGFTCRYSCTTNEEWQHMKPDADFIVIAGGDGTVKKAITDLIIHEPPLNRPPIGLLPLGTANNIARSLHIQGEPDLIIDSWHSGNTQLFDVGELNGTAQARFVIESYGYGIFPYLMALMDKHGNNNINDKDIKIQEALQRLHQVVVSYQPRYCRLLIDGTDYSGNYLLAEIMNIRAIGPNLFLSPDADPGDGLFEVVLITPDMEDTFSKYIESKINGKEIPYPFSGIKAGNIQISWEGTHAHVDDQLLKLHEAAVINIRVQKGALRFLTT